MKHTPLQQNKQALVTGANGFIGKVLCEHLKKEGWQVMAAIRNPVNGPWDSLCCVDLADKHLPDSLMTGVNTVFHLAASADNGKTPTISPNDRNVNIHGTSRLLTAAKHAGVTKFVFLSTVKVMGEGDSKCLDETSAPHPETSYGRSKLEAEKLVLNQKNTPACVLRLPNVYGSTEKGNLVDMIKATIKGYFPPLPAVPNIRSMVHVEDVVQAALLAAGNPKSNGQIYLVTDGVGYSTQQIFKWIRLASGMRIPKWSVPLSVLRTMAMAGDILEAMLKKKAPLNSDALHKLLGSAWYSNEKICRELGFQPRNTLEKSLPELVSGIRCNNV